LSATGAAPSINLLAHLQKLDVQGGNGHDIPNTGQLVQELQQAWGFELSQGRLERLHLSGAASRFTVSIATTVAPAFQYRPTDNGGTSWTAEETRRVWALQHLLCIGSLTR
jgi:hypothetical protein